MKFKKGDIVRMDVEPNSYLNRDKLRGIVLEVRDKGDNIVPVHRVMWATQHQHEWHYAEDLRLRK
jgi:hypothetical protein